MIVCHCYVLQTNFFLKLKITNAIPSCYIHSTILHLFLQIIIPAMDSGFCNYTYKHAHPHTHLRNKIVNVVRRHQLFACEFAHRWNAFHYQ
jgi:hypothetical protein